MVRPVPLFQCQLATKALETTSLPWIEADKIVMSANNTLTWRLADGALHVR